MSKIKAGTTSTTAYQVEADTTGTLVLQTGATPTTALTLGSDQSATFAGAVNAPNTFGFKNRIINGAMMIDQRNAGASVSITSGATTYTTDRWSIFENGSMSFTAQQSSTAPTGFSKSLVVTSTAAVTPGSADRSALTQNIEGFNIADLGWGAAGAAAVTLSFWVRSSLTGQFGGSLQNGAQDYSYPFTFTINSANTFEYKTVAIAGPTAGTWNSDNTGGVRVAFDLGMGSDLLGTSGAWTAADKRGATGDTRINGTNGATLYITGVQLEKGSTATSFDFRSIGTELQLCQRYYEKSYDLGTVPGAGSVTGYYEANCSSYSNNYSYAPSIKFSVAKRATPTIAYWNYNGTSGTWGYERSGATNNSSPTTGSLGQNCFGPKVDVGAAWVVCLVLGHWTASAEL